ncbi:hypothetical protein ABVG11_10035 [Streptomyces sp. HD1123-B1]|uniref:hypothetical protein n=1 Tax=Streptomyces huangiella TaxID=3228804 RepID=UPI003D7EC307
MTPRKPKESENFTHPVATKGDVTVFKPVRRASALIVPIKIINHGDERAFYDVAVRVTGAHGFDTTVRMKTDVVGVYPGASWPTEISASDSGSPLPESPRVTIVKNKKSAHLS